MTASGESVLDVARPGANRGIDAAEIIPRDIHFDIPANATRHWFGGDVIKTVIVDGLSIFLPEGERFFIRSLKHYAAKLGDAGLMAEINGYATQEAFHTREHEAYNRAMTKLGYDVARMEKPVQLVLDRVKAPVHRLAITCAIEHLTATLSSMTLRRTDLLDDAAPAYRRLWIWHALEELEHKAVALEVFQAATATVPAWQRYLLRVAAMNATIVPFLLIFLRNVPVYAHRDGVKTGLKFWLRFVWVVLVAPGFWRRCLPSVLRYYRPGFDPRNEDDAQLVRKGRAWLAQDMATGGIA
jgi:uncharacterized protein